MEETNIEITYVKFSTDSKYVEFSVSCPITHHFNKLYVYNMVRGTNMADISKVFKKNDEEGYWYTLRLNKEGFSFDSMIRLDFGIVSNTDVNDIETRIAYCSDVNNVFFYILGKLLDVRFPCRCDIIIPEEVKLAYTLLYSHTEAMRLGREKEALFFYTALMNNLSLCGDTKKINNKCNCHG